jgi:starch phosphorylase
VTPRRWLAQANPALAALIDEAIGTAWRRDLDRLAALRPLAEDAAFRERFAAVKRANKQRLAGHLRGALGLPLDPDSLFDVQVKRVHEYKRQLLNLLQVVARYLSMIAEPQRDWVPRTVLFAGKAASSYVAAKTIIRLIHDVASVVNHDLRVAGRLAVAFVPNYGVSVAETLMPAANLSEQISTAGTEASGTGNMKLALNGALTIGTDDGANIEIREAVGDDNIFIFGLRTPEVEAMRREGYHPAGIAAADPGLKQVLDAVGGGLFSPDEPGRYRGLVDSLLNVDHYLLLADFADYVATQARVDALYGDPAAWQRKAVLNVAGMGPFSSDRTIAQYASEIWRVGRAGAAG